MFDLVLADPAWRFADKLGMSEVKRGADAVYASTMSRQEIIELGHWVRRIRAENAVLILWVPDSMLEDGLRVVRAWGFEQRQILTWVKTGARESRLDENNVPEDLAMAFGMGRIFRNCDEHALICTHGSVQGMLKVRNQRNLVLAPNLAHSAKPEGFHNRLEQMFPAARKLEMFARRARPGWTTIGNECPGYEGVDIRDALAGVAGIPRPGWQS